ncbi:Piezo-type mechanosensitive ion channel component 2 [Bagarius yarrelli]|uniref:Piezo-type mechanosensitive ion channel component 2 n=1 Tax=Bagarius yarrelli TaxID=175774 RepID=A0A556TJN9_BAGYA|nr:Piezo-type mechanosensitive ion channel component 2 [Bagarius yarrelli]
MDGDVMSYLPDYFREVKAIRCLWQKTLPACLFRYNVLSFVYLIYLLLIPLFAEPTKTTMQGSSWEKSIRQLGFESVRGADAGNGIRVFIPDIGMFIAGLVTWLLCRSLEKPPGKDILQHNTDFNMGNREQDDEEEEEEEEEEAEKLELEPELHLEEDFELDYEDCNPFDEELDAGQEVQEGLEPGEEEEEESTKMKILRQIAEVASRLKEIIGNLIATAGKVVVTILLGFTGIMLPSLTSAVYFFTFLSLCTWWSFCRSFDTLLFSCLCVLMVIFSAGHLIILYLYQFQFFQEAVPPGDRYASLFGISPVVLNDCSHTWMFKVNPELDWHHFVNPIMLLVLYYTLATLVRLWLQEPGEKQVKEKEEEAKVAEENEQQSPVSTEIHPTAEKKREMWRMTRYLPDERKVLIVTSNGGPIDLMTLSREHAPVSPELFSTPKYKSQDETDKEREDACVYEIGAVLSGIPGLPERPVRVNAVVKIFRFVMKQSYICALIAMMAWSITYVSWLTFVFLIWSCTLWMVRDRRKYAMITSPFMVFYGDLLIVLQYIWSFQTLQPVPGLFLKKEVPFKELGSKILCLLSFWLLLRQSLTERRERQKDETQLSDIRVDDTSQEKYMDDEVGGQKEMMDVLGTTLVAMLNKYWIYICGGMFFFVSFEGRIVMYKIIYMMMFLFCVALYQLNYERWRWMLKYFWMSVVVYTMLVLILIYTFQFESSLHVWSNITGFSKEKLEDLGLERFSVPALFTRIFIPTSFLLVCILHLHYFHERFLQLTDIKAVADKQKSTISRLVHLDGSLADLSMIKPEFNTTVKDEEIGKKVDLDENEDDIKMKEKKDEEICDVFCENASFSCHMLSDPEPDCDNDLRNKWHLVMDRLTVLFLKFLQYVHQLQMFIWWLLELHIIKIVSSYIIWVSVKEVSLFNYVFLVSWAFALPFSQFRPLASSVCTVWTCVIIVCKMLYQLTSIQPETYSKNCSMPDNYTDVQRLDMARSLLYSSPVDPANWVGLKKFSPLLENLRNNLLMLALLAFEVTVYRHQDFYRMRNNLTAPVTRTIFHNITHQHLDDGIINCAKYFVNYFFYKFGLETCFLLAVNVIGQRMDFCAMLHAFALIAVLYQRRRKAIAAVWPKYCCFLACVLIYQYLICIGIPPAACSDYPWRRPLSSMDSNVVKWLYLPDFHTRPNPLFLLYDFLLLLCASLQRHVFEEENDSAVRLLAGSNVEICRDLDAATFSQHNPVPDFIRCRSYLDMLKVIMFSYLFWFVLTIIFITGTTRISIFCMGYLVACFYFLLFGGELLLKPIKTILRYWDFLIAYNVFVITMKNILSIAACGYIKALVVNHCWLIQLFSLACTIKGYSRPEQQANKQCELPSDEAGIIWDSICFASLLLQRRVFMSYYFLHVVADIRSSQVLASRGAELFQATIVKAVKARLEEEKKSMDLLKRQMDRIKSRQQKFKRGKERMLSLAQESGESQSLSREEVEDEDDLKVHVCVIAMGFAGETSKEMRKGTRKQWWRPWVDHASMVRSGNYYLFETDSEEEEEEEEKKEEESPKKSAFQRAIRMFVSVFLALLKSVIRFPKTILYYAIRAAKFVYHAWITDSKTAMKERSKERRRFWQRYTEGRKSKKDQQEANQLEDTVEVERSDAPDNILKRVFNIVKFSWVLFMALLDSFTAWLNSMCQEYIDISTVLRTERCMLTNEVKKGNTPSRGIIHMYYQQQLCRRSSSETVLEETERLQVQHRDRKKNMSFVPNKDSLTSVYTESTMTYSQSTLASSDTGADCVPMTSERFRPKLRRLQGVELSSSSSSSSSAESSGSAAVSENTQCASSCSHRGTGDTIQQQDINRKSSTPSELSELSAIRRCSSEIQTLKGDLASDWDAVLASEQATGPRLSSFLSEADIPPSYSKATGLDSVGEVAAHGEEKKLRINAPDSSILPSLSHELTASELLHNRMFYDEELEESERFYSSQPQILQLCYALYNMLVAHSEMVCYLVIILNHMVSASVATLVLPILIFLWAMLSVPRPSKRFWMTAIVYTEVTIVIKYFFQFGFFPFNQNIELDKFKPFHPPNIIGVEKKEGYVHYDLVQLLALFFHRSILKCHGLWDEDDTRSEAKKTLYSHSDSESSAKPSARRERASLTRSTLTEASSTRMAKKFSNTSFTMRRHSSSAGSHISHRSTRSRGGGSVTRSSVSQAGSVSGVQQKSRKELIMEKFREQLIKAKKLTIKITLDIFIPIRQFFYNLIHPEYSAVTDVYVLMFLADTVDFIIIVFGFWAFGKHSAAADITSSLSEDQVPEAFLVMVLIQFATMVVDRALYLRKTVMGKVIFQVILVFGIHIWMFFILPGVTERRFSQNMVAQLWYFVKCIYFGLSAYQIRCGYPTRVLGNFLTKSYNYVNLFLFQGFRLVPFLTELRAVMDWVWTDTTLSLSNWICVEDIYAHIFVLKCWRESEKRYPQPRGQKKKKVVKYGMGGMIVMLLICIVWFPLLFMSLVKSVAGVVNKPLDVSVTITLGGFQPIFMMSAQQNQLKDITEAEFLEFMNSYNYIPSAMQFLEAYTAEDVTVAELAGSSNSLWTISPPSRKNLMDVLNKEDQFPVTMSWTIQRNPSLGAKAEIAMDKHVTYLDMITRHELIELLNGTRNGAVVIKQVFPCFIRAPSDSNAKPIEQLYKDGNYKDILLDLERTNNSSGKIQEWWVVDQPFADKINIRSAAKAETKGEAGLQLYVFNDKVSPPSLGFLAGYGIMGLYASVVLVIGKFVREFFSGISHSIMFEELPCVDRILKLCTDIFLVRETGELELEEDLYAKLIFLYRSPETMIKWTREKTK